MATLPPIVPDQQAIQGTWEIVENPSQTRFPYFGLYLPKTPEERKLVSEIPDKTARVTITDKLIKIRGEDGTSAICLYSVNPKAEPKQIDILDSRQIIRGIYTLHDGNLKLCLSNTGKNDFRPNAFWPGLRYQSRQLVLRRIGKAVVPSDERTVEGRWYVTGLSRVIDHPVLFGLAPLTYARDLFFDRFVRVPTQRFENGVVLADNAKGRPMLLSFDATKTPHTFSPY